MTRRFSKKGAEALALLWVVGTTLAYLAQFRDLLDTVLAVLGR